MSDCPVFSVPFRLTLASFQFHHCPLGSASSLKDDDVVDVLVESRGVAAKVSPISSGRNMGICGHIDAAVQVSSVGSIWIIWIPVAGIQSKTQLPVYIEQHNAVILGDTAAASAPLKIKFFLLPSA